MDLAFLPTNVDRWDQGKGDLFAVCIFSEIRPLRGPAGLLDWRLNGKLSLYLRQGRMSGAVGEKTLFPTRRIPWKTVLVLGLGASATISQATFHDALDRASATMEGLHLHKIAMGLPGREVNLVTPEKALEWLHEWGSAQTTITHFTIVDNPTALRLMAESLDYQGQSSS